MDSPCLLHHFLVLILAHRYLKIYCNSPLWEMSQFHMVSMDQAPCRPARRLFLIFHTSQHKTPFFVSLWSWTPFPPELHALLQWIRTSLECSFLVHLFFTNLFKITLNPKCIGNNCSVHSTMTVILGETYQNFWSDPNFVIVLLSFATSLKFPPT